MTERINWIDRMTAKLRRRRAGLGMAARPAVAEIVMAPPASPVSALASTAAVAPLNVTVANDSRAHPRTASRKPRPLTRLERFDLELKQRVQREQAEALAAAQVAKVARAAAVVPSTARMFIELELAQAGQNERSRIQGILEAPEARGREGQAKAFAFQSGLAVEHVRHALAAIHIETEDEKIAAAARRIVHAQSRGPADVDAADTADAIARRIAGAGPREAAATS